MSPTFSELLHLSHCVESAASQESFKNQCRGTSSPAFDVVKRLPAVRETRVRSLGREDPLEKEMATHSSTLAWKIPWAEEPGELQSMGRKELDRTEQLHFHIEGLHWWSGG